MRTRRAEASRPAHGEECRVALADHHVEAARRVKEHRQIERARGAREEALDELAVAGFAQQLVLGRERLRHPDGDLRAVVAERRVAGHLEHRVERRQGGEVERPLVGHAHRELPLREQARERRQQGRRVSATRQADGRRCRSMPRWTRPPTNWWI